MKTAAASFERIVVIGGGRYGTKAVKRLRPLTKSLMVVDLDPNCQAAREADRISGAGDPLVKLEDGVTLAVEGGTSFLQKLLGRKLIPDYVIPSVPGNIMAPLFVSLVTEAGYHAVEDSASMEENASRLSPDIVFNADARHAVLVTSFAKNFICDPGCMEQRVCPVTGEPRETSMFEILSSSIRDGYVKIFLSSLLDLEVGGIKGGDIRSALAEFEQKIAPGMSFAVGTACRCHGITDFDIIK